MGKICYIMGKSSSGKDTIFKEIKEQMPELKTICLYTTRPIRHGETEGVEYHFVGEEELQKFQEKEKVIEVRAYHTKCGIWKYFTADDGQIELEKNDYVVIGTLESYEALCGYFGREKLLPIYVEVEDGQRLARALKRERKQEEPKYAEMCRRFLADSEDFSEENLQKAGISVRFENEDLEQCIKNILEYIKQEIGAACC